MLRLVPEIREYFARLTRAEEVRYFSVRRMSVLADLPAQKKSVAFRKMKRSVSSAI